MALNLDNHPCFNASSRHKYGRVHLPVAPRCNIQCNFCNRKYDCANESRPGVTSTILSPGQALAYLRQIVARDPRISVVGIAGPGDPFANPDETLETLRRVRAEFPEMLLCVASNGLDVAPYAEELAELEVSHVTITLNAVDPEIGSDVYAWVRDGTRVLRGREAAECLLERQLAAIRTLKDLGVTVKVNTIVIPGVNDKHALTVAEHLGKMGVDILNCLPLYPVDGSAFEDKREPTLEEMGQLRVAASAHVAQMRHCARCRADAVGLLGEGASGGLDLLQQCAQLPLEPGDVRPRVAVASYEGQLVNQHLGEASALWVYEMVSGTPTLVERRETPARGGGEQRWQEFAEQFNDCAAILVSGAGERPITTLARGGIRVHVTEGLIETALQSHFEGKELPPPGPAMPCGVGCSGNGMGCG